MRAFAEAGGGRWGGAICGAVLLVTSWTRAGISQTAQQATATVQAHARFEGTTSVRVAGRADSVRVDIRLWSIAGGQRIAALDLPVRGLMIVELRGGRLTTVIGGRRVERRVGEIWSVPEGTTMQIETEDDMATVQTIVVRR